MSDDRITLRLWNAQQGYQELLAAWHWAKAMLMAGHRLVLTIRAATRSDLQSAKFHAMIGDISKHIGGDLADEEDAKRILMSAFRLDTLRDFEDEWAKFGDLRIGRGLRGETVLMGAQTRDLTVKLGGAFIEWLDAFGAEQGVKFKAPRGAVDQATGEIAQ